MIRIEPLPFKMMAIRELRRKRHMPHVRVEDLVQTAWVVWLMTGDKKAVWRAINNDIKREGRLLGKRGSAHITTWLFSEKGLYGPWSRKNERNMVKGKPSMYRRPMSYATFRASEGLCAQCSQPNEGGGYYCLDCKAKRKKR